MLTILVKLQFHYLSQKGLIYKKCSGSHNKLINNVSNTFDIKTLIKNLK